MNKDDQLWIMANSFAMNTRRFGIIPNGLAFEIMTQHLTPDERAEVHRLIVYNIVHFGGRPERTEP